MKSVLLTGVTSKIGRAVVPVLLERGFALTGLCRNPEKYENQSSIELIKHDLSDPLEMDGKFDYVVHIASYVPYNFGNKDSFESTFTKNLRCMNNLLSFSAQNNLKKFVFTSSVDVYGDSVDENIDENSCLNCTSNYGLSKVASEDLLNVYFHLYSIKSTIFRLSYVYGAGMGDDRFLRRIVNDLKSREKVEIYNPDNVLNVVNVKDVAFALAEGLDGPCGTFNLSQSCSLGEYVDAAKAVLQVTPCVEEVVDQGSVTRRRFNTDKLKKYFGWEPSVTLSAGVKQIVEDL